MAPKRESEIQIGWTTITYRSVVLAVLFVLLLAGVVMHFTLPEASQRGVSWVSGLFSSLATKLGLNANPDAGMTVGDQQAHFTALDGTVRVKKRDGRWVSADWNLPLEKGDVVQTSSEGMARVVFADGAHYTVKPDSLIVIEENSTNAAQQTQVKVQVTTGTVDLTTAPGVQGSKSQVTVAGAVATIGPESAAMVRNDPRADQREILLKKGSGRVQRGSQVVDLRDYEKVTFKAEDEKMVKVKEARPPTLIAPANMMPIFATGGASRAIDFSWTPIDNTRQYHVRISRNPFFSSLVLERKVANPGLQVQGLPEGAYYWVVQSIDASGRTSLESEKNRFTVIPKGAGEVAMMLEIEPFLQHGRLIQIRGKTEKDARVMVNGQEVPYIEPDGSFRYFTPPLADGENVITITAQNARGGVNTQQKKVLIQ